MKQSQLCFSNITICTCKPTADGSLFIFSAIIEHVWNPVHWQASRIAA